ncbi:unnamed protein product [Chironomus riparius]|nr:unnamed protein product [Chironomus riparius]
MAEGILAMYKRNTLTLLADSKGKKTLIHWILQTSGGVLAIVGIVVQIISRFRLGKPHFSLIHSIIGLISFIFLILSIISGCSALYSIELKRYLKPIFSKFIHNLLAIIAFVTGIISVIIAYDTKSWAKKHDPGNVRVLMMWLLAFIIIFTLIGPIKTLWNHLKTITNIVKSRNK